MFASDKVLLSVIRAWDHGAGCFLTRRRLIELTELSDRTVTTCIKRLEQGGYIRVQRGYRKRLIIKVHQVHQAPEAVHQVHQAPEAVHQVHQAPEAVHQVHQAPEAVHQVTAPPEAVHQVTAPPEAVHQVTAPPEAVHQVTAPPDLDSLELLQWRIEHEPGYLAFLNEENSIPQNLRTMNHESLKAVPMPLTASRVPSSVAADKPLSRAQMVMREIGVWPMIAQRALATFGEDVCFDVAWFVWHRKVYNMGGYFWKMLCVLEKRL